jgi:exosome complex RNA-binding protein Rrp42 (RNase PH superfamily)
VNLHQNHRIQVDLKVKKKIFVNIKFTLNGKIFKNKLKTSSPSASPEYVGRGGESLNLSLSTLLLNILQKSNCINWNALCITEGKQCWVLYLDALVLDSDGNLSDALSIAAFAALKTCNIPKIEVMNLENGLTEIDVNLVFF